MSDFHVPLPRFVGTQPYQTLFMGAQSHCGSFMRAATFLYGDEYPNLFRLISDIFTHHCSRILLSRALRKTSHLLRGLSRTVPDVSSQKITYYALDLERRELERTLGEIANSSAGQELVGKVDTKGMWGTYHDGLKFIEDGGISVPDVTTSLTSLDRRMVDLDLDTPPLSPVSSENGSSHSGSSDLRTSSSSTPNGVNPQLHFMFLGSSLGNFSRVDAPAFLRSLPLRPGSGDTLLIGLDQDNEKALIEEAYNDPNGYTRRFIFNALTSAGRALGNENMFDENKWEYVNTYNMVCTESHMYNSKN